MVNSSLSQLSDYPFQRLRDLLDHHEVPEGITPLAMSIGEPQHQPPALLQDTINANALSWNKYPPIAGNPDLKAAIKEFLDRRYDLKDDFISTDDVLPVCGTREALFLIGNLLIERVAKGEEKPLVLVPNPFYQVYVGAAVMNEAQPVYLPAGPENDFMPDLSAVDEETWKKTAMLFLCSPGNPQGMVCDLDYLRHALELARTYDFTLIMDECYAELYDADKPHGAMEVAQETGSTKNLLVFHSLSKRSSAAGLRSGFVAGDPDLIKNFVGLRNYGGASMPLPLQAASAALWRDDAHVVENRRLYKEKIDTAERILGNRLGFYRPAGGFFLWLDVRERWANGEEAALEIWKKAGVRVIPGNYLAKTDQSGVNPGTAYIRLALVHEQPIIEEALNRIGKII
ncbi:aminotransferase class I/II-fold pyridoxal phosphate-dependent enzyme [Terasakiella sp. A23]|uniref:aminotransferase class I/II-fold pyridoxal phosphate-dependent enzyme n=1 Tax=Terasakiella sp. FCG-A23 TaxID=3080561 RepID=UPI002952D925|nr:aminotransferase class I/II-fold pyridoxal phosphate-dependent enzyme [Terasakiella sp. A23]MDV7341176.1 aminotransferase class I/II-fold pyridoxal phosphate-dependent enzyme [Terasakiella sp. A23]